MMVNTYHAKIQVAELIQLLVMFVFDFRNNLGEFVALLVLTNNTISIPITLRTPDILAIFYFDRLVL